MTDLILPPEIERDPAVAGILKRRLELMALRRELTKQIKAVDQSIALLTQAVAVFDPKAHLHRNTRNLKPKRHPKTRRFVLDILREASGPLTRVQIASAWMSKEEVEDTPYHRRLYGGRVGSALQNCRAAGLAQNGPLPGGELGWRLAPGA